jgi:hypothetical protein
MLAPDLAMAQSDDERARMHFQAGRSYFEQGRYEDSLREWQESYRLSDRHILLVNIANAQERLFQFNEAIESLNRYLQVGGPDATENRATIEARIDGLRRSADRFAANQGSGDTTQTTEPTETTPTETTPTETSTTDQPTEQPAETSPEERPRRLWTWVGVGATGAFGVVAIATGAVALSRSSELEDGCTGNTCPSSLQDTRDSGYGLAIATDVFIGLTAAAAIGTVVAIVLEGRRGRDSSTARLVPTLGPGHAGLSLSF